MSERFDLLPEDAQNAVAAFDYDGALRGLHQKHKLHIDQAAALEKNVADIVFGERKSHDLITHLMADLHIDHATAETVAFDTNDTILKPLQEAMKKIQSEE